MKNFNHINVDSFDAASFELAHKKNGKTVLIAGGTDLMNILKEEILPEYPDTVINIKNIPDSEGITVGENGITIGALTKLVDIAESQIIKEKAIGLGEAAKSVASSLVRNAGTIGGNICQDVRCWYYRYPHSSGGRMVCQRKGGSECYAIRGDNRYHSIFGGMKTHRSSCTGECPAGTDIPAYMEQIRKGNTAGAAQIIMEVNPMPALTSRVCAHFCQDGCNRGCQDEDVAIGNVERYVGDYILENSDLYFKAPATSTGKSVAIIGAGPSGLSAAYYLRRAGNDVTIYDTKKEAGGMLMYAIPAYRLPKDIVRKFVSSLKKMGINIITNTTIGKDIQASKIEEKYDSVFYATGAWKRPVIGIAGEELTEFGLDFLIQVNEWMKGKVGSEVLVTGGGNVAMDVAITAKRLGAKKVTMACLECESDMPASREEIARAREEGVIIMPSWGLSKVIEENGVLKGMELKRCTSTRDEKGAFSPQYDHCETQIVNAENILMAVGQQVDLSFLDEKYQVQLNQRGLIDVSEETQMTSREGVFAGGDATTGPATVIKGIANGHKAANGMNKYLGVVEAHIFHNMISEDEGFITFDPEGLKVKTAAKLKEIPADKRSIDKEDAFSLSVEEVLKEASRCMNCGCYAVNASDISPVLIAMDATIITNKKKIKAVDFFTIKLNSVDMLDLDELVKAIFIPDMSSFQTHYEKLRIRRSIDFALVSCASAYKLTDGKINDISIVLGGVAPVPYKLAEVEELLIGKEMTSELVEQCVDVAMKHAMPLEKNTYKLSETRSLVKQLLSEIN
ncbi:FAD-dependent oxidoreductase [Acetobacterium tundrae]|uniref:FAD-dependent oxidoreductase n=1 Tax=Acetobacterium tundrae TaxID=132932 RepID=A0ABR6WPH0_9FIRM|nr:FAD-dependent oxidoreductase [Acetobacterium tundrae]MBC3798244.1 FAD-dependent oxidoreductase [Acetobacterium tundrae]